MSFGGTSLEAPGVFPLVGGTQESKASTKAMDSFKPHARGLLFLQRTRQNLVQGKEKKKTQESPALWMWGLISSCFIPLTHSCCEEPFDKVDAAPEDFSVIRTCSPAIDDSVNTIHLLATTWPFIFWGGSNTSGDFKESMWFLRRGLYTCSCLNVSLLQCFISPSLPTTAPSDLACGLNWR